MNLACGGLGTKQKLRRQIEGILHIAGRMVLRSVQGGEIIVIGLDLRALVYLKAHGTKNINELVADQGDGVQITGLHLLGGHGDVHLLTLVSGLQLLLFHLDIQLGKLLGRPLF